MTRNRPSDAVDIRHGDALDVLRGLPDESVDAYITDPPYGLSQEPDMAEVLTHWLAGDDYKHRGGGFMGRCLHPDSDVLTSDGWAPVDKVAVGDRVCSLNPATGEIEYVPVVETHRYDYDGDLLRVGGRSAVQVVTPNHNVWAASGPETEWSLRRADSLPRNFMLHNQGVWLGEHTETLTICGKTFRAEPLMRFLGMWLGDGYVCVRRNQPEKQDFIGFSAKKGRKLAAFESACADLGVRYTATPDAASDRTAFYVYDKALLAWLTPLGKAHDKRVPSGILNLSAPLLESLYQGLIETDGTRQGVKGQQVFYTTSEALADDFQTLCLHTGRSAGKTWREGGKLDISGRTTYGDGCWTLSVIQTGKTGYWMDRDGRADRPQPASVVAVPHHGHVSCVTLERHHVMLTRYDGKTVWTGNSWDSFVPGPAVWREAYRVLKPGGHLLCFAGTRTSDLMGISIRLAGFEIRDRIRCETTGVVLPAELAFTYGQGFPKSHDVGKAIDKAVGAERDVVGRYVPPSGQAWNLARDEATPGDGGTMGKFGKRSASLGVTAPATEDAARWDGWGTALKPAFEPIIVARKPLIGTVAQNVLTYGTGALNIDATRVGWPDGVPPEIGTPGWGGPNKTLSAAPGVDGETVERTGPNAGGRWPSNVVLVHGEGCVPVGTRKVRTGIAVNRNKDAEATKPASVYGEYRNGSRDDATYGDEDGTETVEAWECVEGCPVAELDTQSGTLTSGGGDRGTTSRDGLMGQDSDRGRSTRYAREADAGGASRFFATFKYQAKADGSERPSYIGPVCHSDLGCSQVTDEMHPSVWPEWARDPKGVCPECGTPCGPIMHPTVKPLELARWLIRLVVAKGGTFIDPFVGSGTFAEAAILEGVNAIVVDKVGAHIPLIEQRVTKYDNPHAMAAAQRGEKVATRAKARKSIVTDDEDDLFADWAS